MTSLLKAKINNRTANIAVVGLGYVGLPLVSAILNSGYRVYGIDKNIRKIEALKMGESYIENIDEKLLGEAIKNKQFVVGDKFDVLHESDCVLICVPTPLDENKTRFDISLLKDAVKEFADQFRGDQLLIIESTIFPGATRLLQEEFLSQQNMKLGENLFVAHSPERVDPGNSKYCVENTDKLVGGLEGNSTELANLFYSNVLKAKVHQLSKCENVEMTKLLENTYRFINIAFINEFSIYCNQMGYDVKEIINAAATKPYGFQAFYPGPGIGGHCIPIDPIYLQCVAKETGFSFSFIENAVEFLKAYREGIVARIKKETHQNDKILFVGISYKPQVKDVRESPTIEMIADLLKDGYSIDYYDENVEKVNINGADLFSIQCETNLEKYKMIVYVHKMNSMTQGRLLSSNIKILDLGYNLNLSNGENIIHP